METKDTVSFRRRFNPVRPTAWHICIGGFQQHEGEPNGTLNLWQILSHLRSPKTVVMLREWNADWSALADLIFRASNGRAPAINIYGYSWGAGYGAMQLARQLGRRGLQVHKMVLADPVYRSRWFLLRWLALRWWPVIRVPANVAEVWSTYQRENHPQAHAMVAADGSKTIIHRPMRVKATHGWMDDHPVYQELCFQAAGLTEGCDP
jgi:hypothetical protein